MGIDAINSLRSKVVNFKECKEVVDSWKKWVENPDANTKLVNPNVFPYKEINFTYSNTDELLEEISKRYDMENLRPEELSQVLNMLKEGGLITPSEYWLGQSVIPVVGSNEDFPMPVESKNALKDYYTNYEAYVNENAHLYSPSAQQRLHDSVLVHKKVEGIFKQIHTYRT